MDANIPPAPSNALSPDGVTRWKDLQKLIPCSREWVRLRELEGKFPKRIQLTPRCSVWLNGELRRWFADPENYRAEG